MWRRAQHHYRGWANSRLSSHYIKYIIHLGNKFMEFIGRQGKCLDIGCGNGLIGGKSYKTVGYSYLKKGAVTGIDPLTLQGPKQPWLNTYARGVCEHLSFKDDTFDTVVFATTIDHIEKIDEGLQECRRVLKRNGTVNIWVTCRYSTLTPELAHPNRFTKESLEQTLTRNGFKVVNRFVAPFIGRDRAGRQVASGDTVFIKACKN